MKQFIEKLRRFCAFVTGFVFFISGILKILDPVGAGLVIKEYLEFLHIGFLGFAAKGLGTAFALTETIIGAALITGVWRKATAYAAMALQGFFTFLTLALVIFNPQMDCGCFGEAINLSHSQTFLKNIILLVLLLIYYIPAKHLGQTKRKKYVSFGIVTISVLLFAVYSWAYMPLVEFTDFRTGTSLKGNSGTAGYEAVFVYEKDGEQEMFTLEDLPDSSWTFVSAQTIEKKNGAKQAANLSFYGQDSEYADSLATEGKVMIISVYDTSLGSKKTRRMMSFVKNAENAGFKTLLLTTGPLEGISNENIYTSDYKTLITLNRSNGGLTYFHNGYLINKWSMRGYPDINALERISKEDITEGIIEKETQESLTFQAFLLYIFAIMLLL